MFAFTAMERAAIALVMATMATRAGAIDVRSAPGALHGFPSMSDSSGNFDTGSALAVVRHERDEPEREQAHLDLPRGRSFAGYGTALAVSELPLERDGSTEQITFVGFAVKPRAVTLEIRRDGDARIGAAGRTLAAIRFTLHPKLPFPISAVVHVSDAHLWFTRDPPRALLRPSRTSSRRTTRWSRSTSSRAARPERPLRRGARPDASGADATSLLHIPGRRTATSSSGSWRGRSTALGQV